MSEKYSRAVVARLSMDEKSYVVGGDYREFRQAGGTDEDIYLILNRRKTIREAAGPDWPAEPQDLTDAQIQGIAKRRNPVVLVWAYLVAMTIGLTCICTGVMNVSAPVTFALIIGLTGAITVAFVYLFRR